MSGDSLYITSETNEVYTIYKPAIAESTNQYLKITDCNGLDNRLTEHGIFKNNDLYLVSQNSGLFASFVDLMATFGDSNNLGHVPKFYSMLHDENITLNFANKKEYRLYLAPKYGYVFNDSHIKQLSNNKNHYYFTVRNWGMVKRNEITNGANFSNDFICWLSEQRPTKYTDNFIESFLHVWRILTIQHSNIIPQFSYKSFRVDSYGNLILFNIFRSY